MCLPSFREEAATFPSASLPISSLVLEFFSRLFQDPQSLFLLAGSGRSLAVCWELPSLLDPRQIPSDRAKSGFGFTAALASVFGSAR